MKPNTMSLNASVIALLLLGALSGALAEENRSLLPKMTWQIVNDGVMGGRSTSQFKSGENDSLVFTGVVSLENNGGFASVRSRSGNHNLENYDAFVIRVRGDGKRYKFRARDRMGWRTPNFQATFTTKEGEWQEITVPFDQFVPTWRGRQLTDVRPFDPSKVQSLGFLISDKQEGPFRLEVAGIKAIKRPEPKSASLASGD